MFKKIKPNFVVLFLILNLTILDFECFSQHWMQLGTGAGVNKILDLTIDPNGNTVATGYFTGVSTYGSIVSTSNGNSDILICKINTNGVYQWVQSFGGLGTDRGSSISTDISGNIYVTGFFNDSVQFGSNMLFSQGSQDIFVLKLSTNGSVLWAKSFGGSLGDLGTSIKIAANGNIIVAGQFSGISSFSNVQVQSLNNSSDIFLMTLDPTDGSLIWLQTGSSKFDDTSVDIACDANGKIYLTGIFSDTITFDFVHPNTSTNSVYVICFNSFGAESWFRKIEGSNFGTVSSMECSPTGNVYLTGNFSGNLGFFGSVPFTLVSPYFSTSYVVKYNSIGGFVWATAIYSDNTIQANSISLDGNENIWVGGDFDCEFSQLQQFYDNGIFISLDETDSYVLNLSSSGNILGSKHLPSLGSAKLEALAISINNSPTTAISFDEKVIVPTSNNFNSNNLNLWPQIGCNSTTNYCNDPFYNQYSQINSAFSNDFLIGDCIDLNREPFDFYLRSGSVCDRSKKQLVLDGGSQSAQVCDINNPEITFDSLFCAHFFSSLNYSDTTISLAGGNFEYVLSVSSTTSCFPEVSDTIIISEFSQNLNVPVISDNLGVNVNSTNTTTIELCGNANVVLSTVNPAPNSIQWKKNGLTISTDTFIFADTTGSYELEVSDSNGCTKSNSVSVVFYDSIPTFQFLINLPDSATYCENNIQPISFLVFDSISNPSGSTTCLQTFFGGTNISQFNVNATISTSPLIQQQSITCGAIGSLYINDSGLVNVHIDITVSNTCDTATYSLEDSIFVSILPSPIAQTLNFNINGPTFICPQDTIQLSASGDTSFTWFGPNVQGLADSIVNVHEGGNYVVSFYYSDTNQYGCVASSGGFESYYLESYSVPQITASELFLCPGQNTILSVSSNFSNAEYSWQGPSGNININNDTIMVSEFGEYYCIVSNLECALESNTIQIQQYSTPNISALSGNILCKNDSVLLNINSSFITNINWLAPLSGNQTIKTVYESGIYQCEITACGITTLASIQVLDNTNEVSIIQSGTLCLDSFVMLQVDSSNIQFEWNNGIINTPSILVSDSGSYFVTVIDENGCELQDSIRVLIDQQLSAFSPFQDSTLCEGETLKLHADEGLKDLLWIPTLDNSNSLEVTGTSIISLIASDSNGCRSNSDSVIISFQSSSLELNVDDSLSLCFGDSILLFPIATNLKEVYWNGITKNEYNFRVSTSGIYYALAIDTIGCTRNSEPIFIEVHPEVESPKLDDEQLCLSKPISILGDDLSTIYLSELDFTSMLDSGYQINYLPPQPLSGIAFWSKVGSCFSDTIYKFVDQSGCDLNIPNVMTPNGDGINDWFEIENISDSCFEISIFNRWGTLVYYSNSANIKWDGYVIESGVKCVSGVYYYHLNFCTDKKHDVSGSFTLLDE